MVKTSMAIIIGHSLIKFKKKIPSRKRRRVIFLQDNNPSYKEKAAIEKINSLGWNIVQHPLYLPDIAPSDFYLFRNMKSEMLRTRFDDQSVLDQLVITYFDLKLPSWFRHGFEIFQDQLNRVIINQGEQLR